MTQKHFRTQFIIFICFVKIRFAFLRPGSLRKKKGCHWHQLISKYKEALSRSVVVVDQLVSISKHSG
ncbi:CLUMA_CG003969, isoform A [Clunio marinus]|uniref:CLUMA_CG003969, isoform A n=1 Tax=Clunio marinus TaxID=568069 RepID=A0A1J1HRV5_9DIPT|nr:CLUMA_CG003969, isoform A [Clunio marinus]